MKKIREKFIKTVLIALFLSYYFIMVSVNYDRIEGCCSIISIFHLSTIKKLNNYTYIGTYPSMEELQNLKEKKHITRVISLLDPKIPIQRELVQAEEKACKSLNIEFINLPGFSTDNTYHLAMMLDLLKEEKISYINSYFYSKELKIIYQFLHNRAKQNQKKKGD